MQYLYALCLLRQSQVVLAFGLIAYILAEAQAGIIGDRALKLGAAIGATGIGYAVHVRR